MEIFAEQLVFKKSDWKDNLFKYGSIVMAVLIVVSMFLSLFNTDLSILILPIAVAVVYFTYWFVTSMYTEFEYAITEGELDIDRITAKKKRTRIITADCRDMVDFGEYKSDVNIRGTKRIDVSSGDKSADLFFFVYDTKKSGRVMVVFEPDDRIKSVLKKYVPRSLYTWK